MIRILYMSDVHLEMERRRLDIPGWAQFSARRGNLASHPARGPVLETTGKIDLVVLAGDIHNGLRGVIYADQVARYLQAPVVMVAGNHEFYYHDAATLLPALREAAHKTAGRVQFLENTAAGFSFPDGRLQILGCTLWTDYQLHGDAQAAMAEARARMNDHRLIKNNRRIFMPADALAMHQASRAWLHRSLEAHAGERCLIVTHHAPSAAALGTRIGAIAPAYGSDLLHEFVTYRPVAWIHGHTHYRHDDIIDGIRLASAPRGYVGFDGNEALLYEPGTMTLD